VFSATHTADHLKEIVELIAPQGRLALINNEPLELALLMRKCVSIHWESMFTRSMMQTADMAEQHALLDNVAGLVDAGKIRTTVAEHFGTINAANKARACAARNRQGPRQDRAGEVLINSSPAPRGALRLFDRIN
jgi:NADPH2:quinone reductase